MDLTRRQLFALSASAIAARATGGGLPEPAAGEAATTIPEVQKIGTPRIPHRRRVFSWSDSKNPSDFKTMVQQRLEAELSLRMNQARAFYDLKNRVLTGDPQKDALTAETLEQVAEEKKGYYLNKMRRLAALFREDDPRFTYQKDEFTQRLIELEQKSGFLDAETETEIKTAIKKLRLLEKEHEEELERLHKLDNVQYLKKYAFSERLDEWALHEHISYADGECSSLARGFGLVTEEFEAQTQRDYLALQERIEQIARAAGLNPIDVNAIIDDQPFFLADTLEKEADEPGKRNMQGSEPYHYLDSRVLFQRLADVFGTQVDSLRYSQVDSLRYYSNTPENFGYIATQLEADLQRAYIKAFTHEFPEIPLSDIPLPTVHPLVKQWALDSKAALAGQTNAEPAPRQTEPAPAEPNTVTPSKPFAHIGHSLLRAGRGIGALLKRRKKPDIPIPDLPSISAPNTEVIAGEPKAITDESTRINTLTPSGQSFQEKVVTKRTPDTGAERS